MTDVVKWSAAEMARGVRAGELSALELVDAHIQRIEALDGRVNAVVVGRFDEARAEARAAERGGAGGPLHGVPFTVKEAIACAGLPQTNGSRLSADVVAERDAPTVAALRGAGAILLGKTNISEFCMYYDSDNLVYGRTRNPHDPARMPGGSSGGESAAVAAGMSPLGLGSDLGSSIRQPAAWTGVFGVKASRGLTALAGHAFFGLTPGLQLFATIGPLARSAEDLRLGLEVLVGGSLGTATPAPRRIAVYEEDGLQPVAAVCREAVRLAAGALAQAGHELVDDAPPAPHEVRAGYDTMLATELAVAALPQLRGREADLSPPVRGLVDDMSGFEPDLGAYLEAAARLSELEVAAGDWLERHPVALCPVTPVVAPPAAEGIVAADGRPMNAGGKLTLCTYANALGLPAVSVPVMRDEASGMPVGVQLFGRPGHDAEVLALAEVLERALGGFLDPEESPASALRLD